MVVTPTATSGFLAGAGFWLLAWLVILKLDKIPLLNRFLQTKKILRWIKDHKAQALIASEVINLAMHAHAISSPNLMTFVLGGTLTNFTFIYVLIAPLTWLAGRKE